ncbi:MAG: hypothetical protein KFF73_10970 [Cyclobacteriaceae bacterium]|nr:hypothetical protein [Cyclobacteriaceae bacterium]
MSDLPPWWWRYHQLNRVPIHDKMPLSSLTFSVIDIESTGLDPKKDRMIAFAAIGIQHLKIYVNDSVEIIVNHEDDLKDEAIHIHELTRKDIA